MTERDTQPNKPGYCVYADEDLAPDQHLIDSILESGQKKQKTSKW